MAALIVSYFLTVDPNRRAELKQEVFPSHAGGTSKFRVYQIISCTELSFMPESPLMRSESRK
jgi:hypothetical protein